MKHKLAILLISAAATVVGLSASNTHAGVGTGSIRGLVTDPSGAAIPGASVILSGPGVAETLVTGASGEFDAAALPAGHYSLLVRAKGFSAFERPTLVVAAGKRSEADAPLGIRPLKQVLTVHGQQS